MRFLSKRRRHPLAGLAVLALSLALSGGLYALFAPTSSADTASTDLVTKGRQLFLVGCASCHGKNAEGVLTANGNQLGPPLIGVGAASVDFQVGTGRMPMARPDTQAPQKPPQYDEEQIRALAAYVASLGPGPAIPRPGDYDISNVTEEQLVQGGEYFRTNCTACHNFAGAGGALPDGRYAPSLRGVEPKYFVEAMLTGPQQMPVFSDEVLSPQAKREIIAYVQHLHEQPNYGGVGGGSLGPVGEGMFGWVVGIGGLVLACVWIAAKGVKAQ
ncbi:MAG TPA: cytochrome c [Nocardioidaceae bacterium]|nr:cytochrome c [Nocardioidaceae bacterium]